MRRIGLLAWAIVVIAGRVCADEVVVRTQRSGETTYVHVRIAAPDNLKVPRTLRATVDKAPLHDLGRQPRLVPQDARSFAWVWRAAPTDKGLEFLGRATQAGNPICLLLAPTETGGQGGWLEKPLVIDLAKAQSMPPVLTRKPGQAPGNDDLEGHWATAQAREWAIRERLAADSEFFRFARQNLCQRFRIADPMPRPPVLSLPRSATPSVDIARIPDIEAAEHPWERLLAGRTPMLEGLASLVPQDFYYARFQNIEGLPEQRTTELEALAGLLDGAGQDAGLFERYLRQLGFPTRASGYTRLPNHVREFAVIGSDLHFRTGTDLTVLFVLNNVEKFRSESDEVIQALRKERRLEEARAEENGIVIERFTTPDRAISIHRAFVANVAIVSNSPIAVRRVLAARAGRVPALATAPDFRVLRLQFDQAAKREQVTLYASEAFVRRQFSPTVLITAARREQGRSVLKALQYAAVVHRLELRREPRDLAEIAQLAGVPGDDPNFLAGKFAWDGEHRQVVSALWNTLAFSTPILELPCERVTVEEENSYQSFLDEARTQVIPYLTPFGLRLHRDQARLRLELFAMPAERATTWEWVRRHLGRGTIERPEPDPAVPVRLTMSYTSDPTDQARLQQTLIKAGVDKKYFQKHPDWQGDRIAAQIDAGPALARLAEYFLHVDLTAEDLAKAHDLRELRLLIARLPLTLAVEIRRPLIFTGWIAQTKKALTESFPNMFTWETLPGSYRTIKLNRIQLNQAIMLVLFGKLLKPEEAPALWYANNNRLLLLSLNETAMKNGVARELLPREHPRRPGETVNAALDVHLSASADLQSAIKTYLLREAHRQALAAATHCQVLYQSGLIPPEAARVQRDAAALQVFGFVPALTDRVAGYDVKTQECRSGRFGSLRQPIVPAELPPDSPLRAWFEQFQKLHAELLILEDGMLLRVTIER